jgi:hypothetical protein
MGLFKVSTEAWGWLLGCFGKVYSAKKSVINASQGGVN